MLSEKKKKSYRKGSNKKVIGFRFLLFAWDPAYFKYSFFFFSFLFSFPLQSLVQKYTDELE
jgi:hypothetical protein